MIIGQSDKKWPKEWYISTSGRRVFLHFSIFLSFHSKWLRKLEMKCRLKGLRWKDQLFQQRYVDFLVCLLKLTLYDTTVLDKKCSEVSTFLLTGDPLCEFATSGIPLPTPLWSKMFSQEQKCSGCASTLFVGQEGGSRLSEQWYTEMYSEF